MRKNMKLFDRKVAALRGKVAPQQCHTRKSCTSPERWAAKLDYQMIRNRNPASKAAISASNKKWRQNNLERERAKGRLKSRRERRANPEVVLERTRRWRKRNPEHAKESQRKSDRKWRAANPGYSTQYSRKWLRDPLNRIAASLRVRAHQAFKSGKYCHLTVGISWSGLKTYLEMLFSPGMSFDNYGKNEGQWSIDHWFPISQIDSENTVHQIAVNHFTNLRPMWHSENVSKNNDFPPEAKHHFDQLVDRIELDLRESPT
jgi:hypothetical protein